MHDGVLLLDRTMASKHAPSVNMLPLTAAACLLISAQQGSLPLSPSQVFHIAFAMTSSAQGSPAFLKHVDSIAVMQWTVHAAFCDCAIQPA